MSYSKINRVSQKEILLMIFWGCVFFAIGYIEELSVFGVKISVLWKAVFIFFAVKNLMLNSRLRWSPQFIVGGLFFFKSIVYVYHDLGYWLSDLSEAIKFVSLPIMIEYFRVIRNGHRFSLVTMRFFSIWVPISCLPFFVGLNPIVINESYGLNIYGGDEFGTAFAGVFNNNSHVAAITIAGAIMLQLHFYRNKFYSLFKFSVLLSISLFALYSTYVRTGWLCLFVGLAVYFYISFDFKRFLLYGAGLICAAFVFGSLAYQSSDVFRNRLLGTNEYKQEITANQISSGRLEIWENAIEGPASEGVLGVLLGIGLERAKDLMWDAYGMRIFSHNAFLDAYQTSGLVGLFVFLLYLFFLFNLGLSCKKQKSFPLVAAFFGQLAVILLIQGGAFFWFFVIFSAVIGACFGEKNRVNG